jgi:hypothetical protein
MGWYSGRWCREYATERGVVDLCEIRQTVNDVTTSDAVDPVYESGGSASAYTSDRLLRAGFAASGTLGYGILGVLLIQLVEAGGDGAGADAATAAGSDELAKVAGNENTGHEAAALGVGIGERGGEKTIETVLEFRC